MKKKEKPKKETFALGPWNVDFEEGVEKVVNGKIQCQRAVTMYYSGKVYFRGHGKVAYENSIETIKHLYSRGYEPKSGAKCQADRPAHERSAVVLTAGKKESPQLEGIL